MDDTLIFFSIVDMYTAVHSLSYRAPLNAIPVIGKNPRVSPASLACRQNRYRQELRQGATRYCQWEVKFTFWTSLRAVHLAVLHNLQFTFNGRGRHDFVPTTVTESDLIVAYLFPRSGS
jgi:hypothetical protein